MKAPAKPRGRGKQPPPGIAWKTILRIAILVLAGLLVYWPALLGTFGGDDEIYLTDNPLLRDPDRLWKIWFSPGSFVEYYPIEETIQYFQWQAWGDEPWKYYLTNVVLHVINALLVWWLLVRLGLRLAWLGGLLFLVHPLQVESVAWVSEFKNTLSLAPFLVALRFWIDYADRKRLGDYLLALGFFLVAMLCKISMAPFPIFIFIYAWWRNGRVTLANLGESLPFFAIAFVLGYLNIETGIWFWHHRHTILTSNEVVIGPPLSRLALVGTTSLFYLCHFFWPARPLPYYPLWTVHPPAWWHLLPWLVLAGTAGLLWWKRKTWGRHALLGLGFFFLFLAPFLGLISCSYMQYSWVMDHFLYLPMIGLIALLVAALGDIDRKLPPAFHRYGAALVGIVVVLLAWECHAYADIYADNGKAAAYMAKNNPRAWISPEGLGREWLQHGRPAEAIPQFERALQINPTEPLTHYLLANALSQVGRETEAVAQFEEALKLLPTFAEAHNDYGLLLVRMGRVPEGIEHFRKAEELAPNYAQLENNWGNTLMQQGKTAEAIEHYRKAVRIDPNTPIVHLNFATALRQAHDVDGARKEFEEVLRLDPNNARAAENLDELNRH